MPLSPRATIVNGSGCTENTARSSVNGAVILELGGAVVGVVLPVRLGDAELELTSREWC